MSNTKTLFLGRWKGYIILYIYICIRNWWFKGTLISDYFRKSPYCNAFSWTTSPYCSTSFFSRWFQRLLSFQPRCLSWSPILMTTKGVRSCAPPGSGDRILKMFMAQRQNQWSWMMFFVRELREHQLWERLLSHRFKHQRSLRGGASFYRYPVQYHPHGSRKWCKYHCWLVVYLPLWKIWKPVGIIIPNVWKKMFQTTNQTGWKSESSKRANRFSGKGCYGGQCAM